MTGLVGKRVAWRHREGDSGERVLDVEGEVVAVAPTSQNVWQVLVLHDSGSMVSHLAKDLEVLPAVSELRKLIADEDLSTLESFVAETFPNHGEPDEHVVDHAIRLMTELRDMLVKVAGERDQAVAEAAAAKKAKKARGPKGPDESVASSSRDPGERIPSATPSKESDTTES